MKNRRTTRSSRGKRGKGVKVKTAVQRIKAQRKAKSIVNNQARKRRLKNTKGPQYKNVQLMQKIDQYYNDPEADDAPTNFLRDLNSDAIYQSLNNQGTLAQCQIGPPLTLKTCPRNLEFASAWDMVRIKKISISFWLNGYDNKPDSAQLCGDGVGSTQLGVIRGTAYGAEQLDVAGNLQGSIQGVQFPSIQENPTTIALARNKNPMPRLFIHWCRDPDSSTINNYDGPLLNSGNPFDVLTQFRDQAGYGKRKLSSSKPVVLKFKPFWLKAQTTVGGTAIQVPAYTKLDTASVKNIAFNGMKFCVASMDEHTPIPRGVQLMWRVTYDAQYSGPR